jgi:hypothetical protein
MTHHSAQDRSQAMNECIDSCTRCHAICLETLNYCIAKGGEHAAPEHLALLSACADICSTSASTMLRGASVSPVVCGACAEVCRRCAQSCARMPDDAQMKQCAEACLRCATTCTTMAAMASH